MHRIFQTFIDRLHESADAMALRSSMADNVAALDLNCFAYLSLPGQSNAEPHLIAAYPPRWTAHYLRNNYERLDSIIATASSSPRAFERGMDKKQLRLSRPQRRLFDKAAEFGIRCVFTVPVHDGRGLIAALRLHLTSRMTPRSANALKSTETCSNS